MTHILEKISQRMEFPCPAANCRSFCLRVRFIVNLRWFFFDEPTAALDALAETELYEKYHTLLQKKTVLFISHRLASTRLCDRIILLDDRRICEVGTHAKLMEAQGKYYEMFQAQSKYYQ